MSKKILIVGLIACIFIDLFTDRSNSEVVMLLIGTSVYACAVKYIFETKPTKEINR